MSDYIRLPLPDGLKDQIDRARGDVPRVVWIRRAIEGALARESQTAAELRARARDEAKGLRMDTGPDPWDPSGDARRTGMFGGPSSSSESKRDVKPRPKGKA